jgi:hypothetical protein
VRRIAVSDLQAGMVVAKPIMNDGGMVMLSEGTTLTDSLISRLGKMMETAYVFVEGEAPGAKSCAERLADLELRFKKTENEKYMSTIKNAIKTRIEEVCK